MWNHSLYSFVIASLRQLYSANEKITRLDMQFSPLHSNSLAPCPMPDIKQEPHNSLINEYVNVYY